MSQKLYSIYRKDTFALVRSLVVKFSELARATNIGVKERGFDVDANRPDTWKYYLNLAGEYHPADTMMRVRSLDTLEEIDFTRDNLKLHLATAKAYRWGTDDYNQLIRLYPTQVDLIDGIILPVEFDTAYSAPDGKILKYSKDLIESQEDQLIFKIQDWIDMFIVRNHNAAYCLVDELYFPAFLGTLFMQLPLAVLNMRLANCKTEQAHSFHINEYLDANGGLGRYVPYLNQKQKFWLYRNIRYLLRNSGKQETFYKLVDHLLTERNIPLTSYGLRHDYKNLPNDIYPNVLLQKEPVNKEIAGVSIAEATVREVLDKEDDLAIRNKDLKDAFEVEVNQTMRRDKYSELPTKILESEAIDMSDSDIRLLDNVLLMEWIYLASKNRYRAVVRIHNPVNGEGISLSVKDAFTLYWYCFWRARGITQEQTPWLTALDVQRIPLPTMMELKRYQDPKLANDDKLRQLNGFFSPMGEYISTEAFYDACLQAHSDYIDSWRWVAAHEDLYQYTHLTQLRRYHYQNVKCCPTDQPVDYDKWLTGIGLDVKSMVALDFETLATDLYQFATGSNLHRRITFADVQAAMLGLMEKLSSYSIQFLKTISFSNFVFVGYPMLRPGNYQGHVSWKFRINPPMADGIKNTTYRYETIEADNAYVDINVDIDEQIHSQLDVDSTVPVKVNQGHVGTVRLNTAGVGLLSGNIVHRYTTPASQTRLSEYSLDEAKPTETVKPIFEDTGPGPQSLIAGDSDCGYFGTLGPSELINGIQLAESIGLDEGDLIEGEFIWYKFAYKGDILYIPSMNLRKGVKYDTLTNLKVVNNTSQNASTRITTAGYPFTLKLPSVLPAEAKDYNVISDAHGQNRVVSNTYLRSQNGLFDSEFTRLMMALVSDYKDDYIVKFSEELAGVHSLKDIGVSGIASTLEAGECFMGQELVDCGYFYPDVRKTENILFKGVAYFGNTIDADTNTPGLTHVTSVERLNSQADNIGWRPVLVLLR